MRRSLRHGMTLLALTATLLVAAPASALAAGPRDDDRAGVWELAWERLADLWGGAQEAIGALVPRWENDGTKPAPPPGPPPGKPGKPGKTNNGNDGDAGAGLDPNGKT